MRSPFLLIASIAGALAVLTGALGAHALKPVLAKEHLEAFETAVRYQFYHALALLAVFLLDPEGRHRLVKRAGLLFLAGIICFSGSVYVLSTRALTGWAAGWLGPVTPLGGLLLAAGWLHLAWYGMAARRKP